MELRNKIVCFLGDSITEGVGVADIAHCRYDNRIKNTYGLQAVYNYGIGGTRIAHQQIPSEKPRHDLCFCGRIYDLEPTADVIVIYGGVNDYIHGDAPIGTPEDTTPRTFYGGVEFLMTTAKELYPKAVIAFITPARMCYKGNTDMLPSPRPEKRPDAMPLKHYVEIMKEKGRYHGIPVLDLYEALGIDPNDPADSARYTVDGLHFNDLGHGSLAARIGEFLAALNERRS